MRYCIGDIHGCYQTFKSLIEQILTHDYEAKFYLVGDLIDRGPTSKKVLDYAIDLMAKKIIIGIVRGNHEQMLLESYENNSTFQHTLWYANRANATVEEFNKSFSVNQKVSELIPESYYLFLRDLPFYIELDDYFIVHAGFNFNSDSPFKDYQSMVWMRDMYYDSEKLNDKKVIHGHTPKLIKDCLLQIEQSNIIDIDTGCFFTQFQGFGFLSALNMDTLELVSIYNIDNK